MISSPALTPEKHRGIPLWLLALSMVLAVGAWSGWNAYNDYQNVIELSLIHI